MPKNTRKIKKKPKVFIDASIIEYRYFDKLKISLPRKYGKIITSKKEIEKMNSILDTVVATEFSIVRNVRWLLEQFSKNIKYKIIEKNKITQYCIKKKIDVITMNTRISTKITMKGGNTELLTNKLQKIIRRAAVIDTCAFGGKNVEEIAKEYKSIYIPSTVIKERNAISNRRWPSFNMIPVWIKENPFLIPDDNILIFCSENNLDLITADKEMAAKAYTHGIKCRLISHVYTNLQETNNIHQTGIIPKSIPINAVTTKVKDTTRQLATRVQFTGFSKEKVSQKVGAMFFSSNVTYDEFVYIIKNNGTIVPKSTAEIKVEKGDMIKHFMQKSRLNQLYCKVSIVKNNEGMLNIIETLALENSLEALENNADFSEQEKELIKQKYFV